MSDFVSSGVTGSVSESGGVADNSPSVPQTGIETSSNSQGESLDLQQPQGQETEANNEAPAAEIEIPENDDDLAHLTEQQRTPLIAQRLRLRELNASAKEHEAFKAQAEPVTNWIAERGNGDFELGWQQVQSDQQHIDALFSPEKETRETFWNYIASQDQEAGKRIFQDVVSDPYVINEVAQGLTNDQIVTLAETRGLSLANAGMDDRPEDVPADVWNAMSPEIREGFYDMTRKAQDWHIADAQARAQAAKTQQAQWQQQQRQARQAAEARTEQAIGNAYTTVRSAVEKSIASLYPNNPDAVNDILSITEQMVDKDPAASAVWGEIQAHIREGQMRQVQLKLPDLIGKAKAIATKVNERHNTVHSDARRWQELMRQASEKEILDYVQRVRGGQKAPQPGTGTTVTSNGNSRLPNPDKAGQYSRENIASYIVRN